MKIKMLLSLIVYGFKTSMETPSNTIATDCVENIILFSRCTVA